MLDFENFGALEKIRTPFYFYDIPLFKKTADRLWNLSKEYGINIHYAVKANSDSRIMHYLANKGFGADCVSGNEVLHAVNCGFSPDKIMFAGVGKTDKEIFDSLSLGIGFLNCESLQELKVIIAIARQLRVKANVAIRINPNVDAHTHKYITTGLSENKFGITAVEYDGIIKLLKESDCIEFKGLQFHIGSQIMDVEHIFKNECLKVNEIVEYFESMGLKIPSVDLGGGMGVDYDNPDAHPIADFASWFKVIKDNITPNLTRSIHLEPGRSVVARCGSLISRVLFVKKGITKNFLVLDAGMNDMIRPALYKAYHKIDNITAYYRRQDVEETCKYDIVGPVCESSDVWGEGRDLQKSLRGDLIAIRNAGAYGQVMSSRYNLKEMAPSVYSDRIDEAPVYRKYLEIDIEEEL